MINKLLAFFLYVIISIGSIFASESWDSKIDSLYIKLEDTHGHDEKYDLLMDIGDMYYFNNPEKALEYFIRAKYLAEEKLKEEIDESQIIWNKRQIAKAIHYIAYVYFNHGDLVTALDLYFLVLNIGEEIENDIIIYNCYNNIGMVHHKLNDWETALEYYEKALAITEETDNVLGKVKLYNNMGVLFNDIGNETDNFKEKEKYYQLAHDNFVKNLNLRIELDDQWGQALCYNNMSNLMKDMSYIQTDSVEMHRKLIKAIDYCGETIDIAVRINDLNSMSNAYGNLSELYLLRAGFDNYRKDEKLLLLDSALYFAKKSFQFANELNSLPQINKVSGVVKNAYASLGDYKKALEYADIYIDTSAELFSEEKTRSLNEMRFRFETEKKDNEIALLFSEKELREVKIEQQKKEKLFFFIIAAVLLVLSALLYFLYYSRKKTALILEKKNNELNLLNSTKDKFVSILAHDLKNPFSAFVNISATLNNDYSEISEEDKKKLVSRLSQSASHVNDLLKNMLDWAVIKHKTIETEKAVYGLRGLIEESHSSISSFIDERKAAVRNIVSDDISVYANKAYVQSVLINLITNGIKFSNNQDVLITADTDNGFAKVIVEDKGVGLSSDDIDKLFRIDVDASTIGKPDGKGTGMGLILCKELIAKIGGKIWAESTPGKGSKFIFTLPLRTK